MVVGRVGPPLRVCFGSVHIFRVHGFELAQGRYLARLHPTYDDAILGAPLMRSELWSRAEEGRTDLLSALALMANRRMLVALAGVPDDSRVEWTIREIGSAGSIGLASTIRRSSGGNVLLMVDCIATHASPARMREQVAQAVRNTLSVMSKISVAEAPSWTKLVVLSRWRAGVPVPTEAKPLPALQREPAILESVPEPQVWGYLTFVNANRSDEVYIALGLWSEFEEEPWSKLPARTAPEPWQRWAAVSVIGYGEGAMVELEEHMHRVHVSLRLRSSAHKASMKAERHGDLVVRRVRSLRAACYSGHMDLGAGRFVGETIEDGVPRLHWDWADGQASSAEAARDAVVQALARHAGLDPKPAGPPP